MNAWKPLRAGACGALAVALAGCAVLTIDVDVYKGPLINSERMKIEQIVAMSVAAKPLLLQLRSTFEQECRDYQRKVKENKYFRKEDLDSPNAGDCIVETTSQAREAGKDAEAKPEKRDSCPEIDLRSHAVPGGCLMSWQARRVNAILSLYQDAGETSECLRGFGPQINALAGTLAKFRSAVYSSAAKMGLPANEEGKPLSAEQEYSKLQVDMFLKAIAQGRRVSAETRALVQRMAGLQSGNPTDGPIARSGKEVRKGRREFVDLFLSDPAGSEALTELRQDVTGAWKKAIELLADEGQTKRVCEDPAEAREWLAEYASRLTDPFEITDFFKQSEAEALAPALARVVAAAPALRRSPDFKSGEREETRLAVKAALLSRDGSIIAGELLKIQQHLIADRGREIPAGLATQYNPGELQSQATRLLNKLDAVATGFERGRRDKGILALSKDYMDLDTVTDHALSGANTRPYDEKSVAALRDGLKHSHEANKILKRKIKGELLDGLTDFGQKVVHVANLQPLLPTNKDDKGKRIQLLQAIGNSILNQIDDYKKFDTYRDRMKDSQLRKAELEGLKAARRNMSGAIVAELAFDVTKSSNDTPRREAIISALAEGDSKLRDALKSIQENVKEADKAAKDAKEVVRKWQLAAKAFVDSALLDKLTAAKLGSLADDAAFTSAARKVLAGHLDARLAEEKKKQDDGEAQIFVAGREAYDKYLSKEVQLKLKMTEADIVKAWRTRMDEVADEAGKAQKAADAYSSMMRNWLGRIEAAVTANARGPDPRELDSYDTAIDVFDDVIRELEYSRVFAARAGLSTQLDQIDQAIAIARQRRATMLYVRPVALYLRDSYPATVLQQSPTNSGAVPNLIYRKLRNAFFAEDSVEDLRTKEQVDKQFWQTVNQIRLGGGGTTNYVVAKDDLGNWYVKGYENDLTSIIESVKGLATYAVGAKFQSSLFRPVSQTAGQAERTPFGKQLDKANADYRAETLKVLVAAREAAGKFREDLVDEYGKIQLSASGKTSLDGKKDEFFPEPATFGVKFSLDATDDDKKDAKKLNEELRALLEGMLAYYKKSRSKLDSIASADKAASPPALDPKDVDLVAKSLWRVTRASIDKSAGGSEKAGAKLDARINLIGELLDAAVAETAPQ